MLNIHERAECRVPVIIEGETGVGKTALVEMLSKLWNYSLLREWIVQRTRILDILIDKIKGIYVHIYYVYTCLNTDIFTTWNVSCLLLMFVF